MRIATPPKAIKDTAWLCCRDEATGNCVGVLFAAYHTLLPRMASYGDYVVKALTGTVNLFAKALDEALHSGTLDGEKFREICNAAAINANEALHGISDSTGQGIFLHGIVLYGAGTTVHTYSFGAPSRYCIDNASTPPYTDAAVNNTPSTAIIGCDMPGDAEIITVPADKLTVFTPRQRIPAECAFSHFAENGIAFLAIMPE